jgi:lysozyme
MNILDKRLYQAHSLDDFMFRLGFSDDENGRYVNRRRQELYVGTTHKQYSALIQGYTVPSGLYILGLDDSHWGGVLDFSKTYQQGMRFCILKCISGTVPTAYWSINRPKAIQAGLIVGEYAWLYPDNKVRCRTQAQATWDLIKSQPKQIPVTIDHEWTKWGGVAANPTWEDLDLWVTEFIRLSGYKPIYYSAAGYANMFGPMPVALRNKFCAFWFANYGVTSPTMPLGFTHWDFWQFTSSLEQALYAPSSLNKKELDGNYWAGSLEQLQQLANVSAPVPPTGPLVTVTVTLSLTPDGKAQGNWRKE